MKKYDYEHIKSWTSSFTVTITCFIKDMFFNRGSLAGDNFKCEGCDSDLNFVEIPSRHTLKGGEMKDE